MQSALTEIKSSPHQVAECFFQMMKMQSRRLVSGQLRQEMQHLGISTVKSAITIE
jgi:hypothetical protein